MKLILLSILLLSYSSNVFSEGCFPENTLKFGANQKSISSMSLNEAEEVIKNFTTVFSPIIKKKNKKKLLINVEWENDKVNAHATRDDLDNPVISILGGMIRHPALTKDGLTLILCHELGHQFGGAPKKFRGRSLRRSWSSAEGQADYFSVTKCLPQIFSDSAENKKNVSFADEVEYQKAKKVCHDDQCIRMVLAGLSVGKVFASLKPSWKVPSIEITHTNTVEETNYNHPTPQCRLMTYISASKCDVDRDINLDNTDPKVGSCFRASNGYSDESGARPLCWYKPQPLFR